MKNTSLTLIAALFLSTGSAQASPFFDVSSCIGVSCVLCAAEVEEGNLAATARVLGTLSAQESFANAKIFKTKTAQIAEMEDAKAQIAAYQALVGIETAEQWVEFLGARSNEERVPYITKAMASLKLSQEQAEQVVSQLSKELTGNLR